jgi:hypothetical protein
MPCYDDWEYKVYGNHGNGDHEYGYDSYSNHYEPNHDEPNRYEPNHSNPGPATPDYYSHKHNDHRFEHEAPKYEVAGEVHEQREIKYEVYESERAGYKPEGLEYKR